MPLVITLPLASTRAGAGRSLVAPKHHAGHRALRRARVVVALQPLYLAGGCLPTDVAHVLDGAPVCEKQAADWPRPAEAWGSLGHGPAPREASGAPAGRSLSHILCDIGVHCRSRGCAARAAGRHLEYYKYTMSALWLTYHVAIGIYLLHDHGYTHYVRDLTTCVLRVAG